MNDDAKGARRVAWRSVGGILERVAEESTREVDLLHGLSPVADLVDPDPLQGSAT